MITIFLVLSVILLAGWRGWPRLARSLIIRRHPPVPGLPEDGDELSDEERAAWAGLTRNYYKPDRTPGRQQ